MTDVTAGTEVFCAQQQTSLPPDKLLNSANAGLIIHRSGQFKYEFAEEGNGFSVDLLNYINENQLGTATTFCYEEVFGVRDRVHWFIHMRSIDEYKKLIHMVENDDKFKDISLVDRLPEKGHGNWEKIFIEASMSERILVPQHGVNQLHDDEDPDMFAPPARNQTMQPVDQQLHSGTAGAIILRSGNVKYEFREEGRLFWWDWEEQVTQALPGTVTCFLYEETFGQQDRIHCLIHLRDLADYKALAALDRSPDFHERIYRKQRIHESKGGGTWESLFVPGTITETLLVPRMPSNRAS